MISTFKCRFCGIEKQSEALECPEEWSGILSKLVGYCDRCNEFLRKTSKIVGDISSKDEILIYVRKRKFRNLNAYEDGAFKRITELTKDYDKECAMFYRSKSLWNPSLVFRIMKSPTESDKILNEFLEVHQKQKESYEKGQTMDCRA